MQDQNLRPFHNISTMGKKWVKFPSIEERNFKQQKLRLIARKFHFSDFTTFPNIKINNMNCVKFFLN